MSIADLELARRPPCDRFARPCARRRIFFASCELEELEMLPDKATARSADTTPNKLRAAVDIDSEAQAADRQVIIPIWKAWTRAGDWRNHRGCRQERWPLRIHRIKQKSWRGGCTKGQPCGMIPPRMTQEQYGKNQPTEPSAMTLEKIRKKVRSFHARTAKGPSLLGKGTGRAVHRHGLIRFTIKPFDRPALQMLFAFCPWPGA